MIKSFTRVLGVIFLFLFIDIIIYLFCLWLLSSSRLFYNGLISFIIILLIDLAIIYFLHKYDILKLFQIEMLIPSALAASISIYAFHITLPVIIDRSISLYILSRIDSHKEGMTVNQVQQSFIDGYINDHNAVCRRLDEQLVSQNITFKDSKYFINQRGKDILTLLTYIANLIQQNKYYIINNTNELIPYSYTIRDGKCFEERANLMTK